MEKKFTYALVTGASSGMGYCYAQQLAARGYNILMVSNEEAIHEKAEIIRKEYSEVQIMSLVQDLGQESSAKQLYDYAVAHQIEVEVLINNAGVYHDRDFLDDSEVFNSLITMLHVYTPTMLCYYFGQDMRARHKGYILNVCSITSTINVQRLGTYGASKAYLSAFTRSLHVELHQQGVYVTNVSPGAVDTGLYNIHQTYTNIGKALGFIVSPEVLCRRALRALFAGRHKVTIPLLWNKVLLFFVWLLPTSALRLIRRLGWF
ncbi:MAG: SDR family NAD(P)-dependent oxidoreductase [Paludibacteraceae bacterium]|nr:SDR family NAD(P)-dependent oxidoreductase [Paludibacteraceae bacterium]